MVQLLNDGGAESGGSPTAPMEAMIAKYTQGFDVPIPRNTSPRSGAVVLLTGTTGGLGSHILDMLLRSQLVERVYAFNRPGRRSISDRQHAAFMDRGLDGKMLSSDKLVYVEGDTAKADLGVPVDVWTKVCCSNLRKIVHTYILTHSTQLRDTLTVIIHNAWMLDFNKTLSSFESHVKGTRHLIDLARAAPQGGVRFLFTSSVASAQAWDTTRGPFPEELQLDAGVAVGGGYGESKYVSERVRTNPLTHTPLASLTDRSTPHIDPRSLRPRSDVLPHRPDQRRERQRRVVYD